jgi:hypothetical protein
MTDRYAVRLADGTIVRGPVHGCGGTIRGEDGLRRLRLSIRRAKDGDAIPLYEPKAGHVRMYPNYSADGDGEPVDVDLRTAIGAWHVVSKVPK